MSDRWISEKVSVLSREENRLWVAAERTSACASCKAKAGCGTSLLVKLGSDRVVVPAIIPEHLSDLTFDEGDEVELAVDRYAFVKVSLLMYLVPLLGLLLGVLLSFSQQDGIVAVCAAFGLLAGSGLVRLLLARWRDDEMLQPIVLGASLAADVSRVQVQQA